MSLRMTKISAHIILYINEDHFSGKRPNSTLAIHMVGDS